MTMIPTLRTERLVMRPPSPEAAAAYITYKTSERSRFTGGPISEARAWSAYAAEFGHWALRGFGRWMLHDAVTDEVLGHVGCWYPEGWPERELSWTVYAGAEGRGLAFEAATAARAFAYRQFEWRTAISVIDPANTRSIALAERLGAVHEGRINHAELGEMGVWRHPEAAALKGHRQSRENAA